MKKIKVIKNGPYEVEGNIPLDSQKIIVDKDGFPCKWQKVSSRLRSRQEKYLLCRCGKSKTLPYCDKTHKKIKFNGRERAKNIPFEKSAQEFAGPDLILKDSPSLCVHARFCDRASGTWELVTKKDAKSKKLAIGQACNCPSGRLVILDKKTGQAIEPKLNQSISTTKHAEGHPGPLWVKGGIPIESAKGKTYEKRNRVTLCCCGNSKNKPFCDGSHLIIKENNPNPINELYVEHGSIKIMLLVLNKINEKIAKGKIINSADLKAGVTFIQEFADKCHHGKEEDLLFPEMKKNKKPSEIKLIKILIKEHTEGRDYVKKMAKAVSAKTKNLQRFKKDFIANTQKYIRLLDQHIDKENQNLFPAAKSSLSPDQIEKLKEGFEDVEVNKIGLGRHKALHKIIERLSKKYSK